MISIILFHVSMANFQNWSFMALCQVKPIKRINQYVAKITNVKLKKMLKGISKMISVIRQKHKKKYNIAQTNSWIKRSSNLISKRCAKESKHANLIYQSMLSHLFIMIRTKGISCVKMIKLNFIYNIIVHFKRVQPIMAILLEWWL